MLSPLILMVLASCTTTVGRVDYRQLNISNSEVPDSKKINIMVESTKRSFFWTSCDELVTDVLLDLKDQAQAFGGNYIANIRFSSLENDRTWVTTPVCETGWGWGLIYVAPVLGPWVKVSSARGEVVIRNNEKPEVLETNPSMIANKCAPMVTGAKSKLVCGDSKDRVIEKWGEPDNFSPSIAHWCFNSCVLEFIEGKLINYGGKCELKKISNDSFEGKRIDIANVIECRVPSFSKGRNPKNKVVSN